MNEPQSSFIDARTIVAVILVGVVFFGWQSYLTQRYPNYYKSPAVAEKANSEKIEPGKSAPTATSETPTTGENSVDKVDGKKANQASGTEESLVTYENEHMSFQISNFGMGLKGFRLKDYTDPNKNPLLFAETDLSSLFEARLFGESKPLLFKISKISDHSLEGLAETNFGLVRRLLVIDPKTGQLTNTVQVVKPNPDFKGLSVVLSQEKKKVSGGNFLMPSLDHQELIIRTEGEIERTHVVEGEEAKVEHKTGSLAAIGSQYFFTGMVDQSEILPSVSGLSPANGNLMIRFDYLPSIPKEIHEFKWIAYVGGKSLAHLQAINEELTQVVNFGFFATIGRWLLNILIWSHGLVGNWGWAIIVLTVLVRLVVLPFNVASYRSMKKMQTIQPLLQSLRERYKNDPATLNRESMLLMKEQKVNPLGGCLPMLLQMPVFFALYQVLGQSIELYQAPWILWITDLSQKDPFYVLPVLMGITLFIQQKTTPTTMDPVQAKVLLWMPVIFSVFTLALPSGLTLYIFISTLFGVIQQKLFMRDNTKTKASSAIIEAKVEGRT